MQIPEANIYVDFQSGKDFNRPMYRKMLRALRADDVVYIKSIDRLGRNYEEIQEQWRILTKEKHVDIVFMDAPYLKGYEKNVLKQLSVMRYVDKDTIIIIEADKKDDFSYTEEVGFEIVRRKEYKGNMHLFLKKI